MRTGWLFGTFPGAKGSFIDKMLLSLKNNQDIKATNDHIGSPTYLPDFFAQLRSLIESDASGIYHVTNPEPTSAAIFMQEAKALMKSSSKIEEFKMFPQSSGPIRSQCEALVSEKIKMRSWNDALKEHLTKK